MQNNRNSAETFISGKRVNLRIPRKEDIPLFLKWLTDPEVNRYLPRSRPSSEKEQIEWFDSLHENAGSQVAFVIMEAKTSKPIGFMGINNISAIDLRATTGIVIGEKTFLGKGYGTEATMLLLDYAFNALNLRKICASVFTFNKRSLSMHMRCGYKVEGILKEQIFKDGKYQDETQLAVFKDNWLTLREKDKGSFRKNLKRAVSL